MAKSLDGLHPVFRRRVEALLADPEARAAGITVVSAFRSIDYQRRLFRDAVRKYGSEAAARKWVAPPGRSNHGPQVDGMGIAVDFGIRGVKAVSGQWPADKERLMNRLAARYHLRSPMDHEDWHHEPIEGRAIRLDSWVPPATTTPAPAPPEDDMTPDEHARLLNAEKQATEANNRAKNVEAWVRLMAKRAGITDDELLKATR